MNKFTSVWPFPLPRTHTGILQGNGTMGIMLWGEDRTIRVTVGRADCWDHRGGLRWTTSQSYQNIRRCLENNDEQGMHELFDAPDNRKGQPAQPSIIPLGRFDFIFPAKTKLIKAELNMKNGEISIMLRTPAGNKTLTAFMDMKKQLWVLNLPAGIAPPRIVPLPAWKFVGDMLKKISFEPPQSFETENINGWIQPLPADPAMAVGCKTGGRQILLATASGPTVPTAQSRITKLIESEISRDKAAQRKTNRMWWQRYWRKIPEINIPHPDLSFLYYYGMYKFAGLTNPSAVPATLQGPWIEEYQMPPWSSDYHFNINVQMCYWPAYHGNCLEHLLPLFRMIESWLPKLKRNAQCFVGIRDGVMLPHAVDDRGTCMGGFWTGSIDHGCTAWVAQMMFRYYLYSGDRAFLKKTAYPFMQGAMRVYEAMLEKQADGSYQLPVSVSPEYRGSSMNAWGRNASFQLACIHRLCEDLLCAANVLNEKPRRSWKDIHSHLPQACIENDRIMLWEGTPLEESHRHHSHLAGITPFDIFDLNNNSTRALTEKSLREWIGRGAGQWSGWCIPWASMLHTRNDNADAAVLWLEIWQKVFTNEGHGTLHDVHFPGFSLIGAAGGQTGSKRTHEIMQIEAGMACTAAIQEMLLHTSRGINILFSGVPAEWEKVSFNNMLTAGGFLISAAIQKGKVGRVSVKATRAGTVKLRCPVTGKTLSLKMKKGQINELIPPFCAS